jgi:Mrp family chromosome partitioning ATPase
LSAPGDTDVTLSPDDETIALARRLFLTDHAGPRHVLVGAIDAAGTSATLALGLAGALGREAGSAVCLIDLNLRGGTLHRRLQLRATPGVSDVIVRGTPVGECLQQVGSATNVSFIGAGSCAEQLHAALRERRTLSSIHVVLKPFGYVVAEASPGWPGEMAVLGSCFDGALLVGPAGTTSGKAARLVAEALKDAGVPLLGTVLS